MTNTVSSRPPRVLLWGAKSKARILDAMLAESGLGETALIFDAALERPAFASAAFFTNDARVLKERLREVTHFVTCIGGEHGYARVRTSQVLEQLGLHGIALIHPASFIEPSARIGAGCQAMPRAVVHKFVEIGEQSILNTNCTIDHECRIGKGVHIMGSAALAGRVVVGDFATIGTNATILPGMVIGEGAFVGAGAVVDKDVAPYAVVAGVPAKFLREQRPTFQEEPLKILLG